jgi:hypothetical protein
LATVTSPAAHAASHTARKSAATTHPGIQGHGSCAWGWGHTKALDDAQEIDANGAC